MSRVSRKIALICFSFAAAGSAAEIDFSHQIVPVLREHCGECHLGEKKKGGFSMNTREGVLEGSENGPVLESGNSAKSYLVEVITTADTDIQMPPKGDRVPAEKIELLKKWIDEGVPWESGFSFGEAGWEPPLKPREVVLPEALDGREHPVDRILDAGLVAEKIPRPGRAGDEAFIRRLYLDAIGILPTPEELREFLEDASDEKRGNLVDVVLARDVDYAEHWLTFWNDLLRNDYSGTGYIDGGRKQITGWLYRSLIDNKPFDQFARELIAPTPDSEGFANGIKWRGNVNASQRRELQFSQNVSQVFLGINMKCASCHDSFIDRWKLEEAYHLAAVFSKEELEIHRCDKPTGELARAAWIFPEIGKLDPDAPQPERLKQLAGLMTHPENGRFTRTIVNRIWHRLMGRGIVHPVDAMHTRPWNEDLLDWLAADFAGHDFDLKHLIRRIVTSEAWQSELAPTPDETAADEYVYRGPIARRMTAEQFLDAVWQITETAPTQPAANLIRARVEPGSFSEVVLDGKWIWANHGKTPAAGESITLRKILELKEKPAAASAVVSVDNDYTLFVNGRKIGQDANWMTAERFRLEGALREGKNEILLVAKNGGTGPNAAGGFFEAWIETPGEKGEDGGRSVLVSDHTWQWSSKVPDGRGKFRQPVPEGEWKPVRVFENGGPWHRQIAGQLRAGLASGRAGGVPPVRASLVKSDLLMRSLGRPNREQVVSVRPEQLTTLQAIDLSNGAILSKTMSRGAGNLLNRFGGADSESMIDWLFEFALSRRPGDSEREILLEMTGGELSGQGIEDLLWSVLMLPEFQLIH